MANNEENQYVLINSADLKTLLDAAAVILSGHKPGKTGLSKEYLTFQEFLIHTGVKRTYLYRLLGEGRIKSKKKGRKYQIPVSELDRYWNDPSFN